MEFLPDQQSVCVASDTGSVLLWNVSSGQIESVGDVSSGIRAMSWSPDQEILVVATGGNLSYNVICLGSLSKTFLFLKVFNLKLYGRMKSNIL